MSIGHKLLLTFVLNIAMMPQLPKHSTREKHPMQLLFAITTFFIIAFTTTFGCEHSFVLQDVDSNEILTQEGDLSYRLSPYSTFKICLSLIGFDTQIFQDATHPVWPYKEEHKAWNDFFRDNWAQPHHPALWMQQSCLWFSQELTLKVGVKTLADYLATFNYGNQDLSGDPEKANGVTNAWLGSSLRISPSEQLNFINSLVKKCLPVSIKAYEHTKEILFVEILPNGMSLYGKTGTGWHALGQDTYYRVGWFVGWVEKDNKRLSFVYRLQGIEPDLDITGVAAREKLKQRLLELSL